LIYQRNVKNQIHKTFSLHISTWQTLFPTKKKFSEALLPAQKALQVANQISPKSEFTADCHSSLGNIYESTQDYANALEHYEKAIKISEKLPQESPDSLIQLYWVAGCSSQSLGKDQEAKSYFKKLQDLQVKFKKGAPEDVAETLLKMSQQLRDQGNIKGSEDYFRQALDIYENRQPVDYAKIADLYGGIGQMSFHLKDWTKALEFFKEREKNLEKFNADPDGVQSTYYFLLKTYQQLEYYDESLDYCNKIIQSAENTGENRYLGWAYLEMGRIYESRGMLIQAYEAYQHAKNLRILKLF